jgi:hypothetical protein
MILQKNGYPNKKHNNNLIMTKMDKTNYVATIKSINKIKKMHTHHGEMVFFDYPYRLANASH